MFCVAYATPEDIPFCLKNDPHISLKELSHKIALKRYFILKDGSESIGLMRYGLFWDNLPFLNMIYLLPKAMGKGYGTQALAHWEKEMKEEGYSFVLTSTQANEQAQFFYRSLGYKDAGCLLLDFPGLSQPTELFLIKALL